MAKHNFRCISEVSRCFEERSHVDPEITIMTLQMSHVSQYVVN